MQIAAIIVFVGLLVFVAHLFEKIFEETKIPDVLLLILLGVFIGPVLGIAKVEDFGLIGPVFIMVALAVILFQGGTKLKLSSLKESAGGSVGLSVVSFILTSFVAALIAYFLTSLGLTRSLMLGAFIGGTSSAIVIPLVRQLDMKEESSTLLKLESAFSDVLAIVVGLAILDAYRLGEFDFLFVTKRVLSSFLVAFILGVLAAIVWSILLEKVRHINDSVFTTPAFVFVVFGLVELLGFSGAIAALSFGIALGNVSALKLPLISRYTPLKPVSLSKRESSFFSEVVFLVKTFFFVYMGISIQLENAYLITLGMLLAAAMLVARVVSIRFSVSKQTPVFDATLMASIAPKGLAAAVLASVPLQMGIDGGGLIQGIVYSVILFSIVFTSIMVFLIEKTPVHKLYQRIFSSFSSSLQEGMQEPPVQQEVS